MQEPVVLKIGKRRAAASLCIHLDGHKQLVISLEQTDWGSTWSNMVSFFFFRRLLACFDFLSVLNFSLFSLNLFIVRYSGRVRTNYLVVREREQTKEPFLAEVYSN